MPIYKLGTLTPELDPQSWVAPNAAVIGQVVMKKNASVWWNCTVRGDTDRIIIGENTNIQDGSIVHTNRGIVVTLGQHLLEDGSSLTLPQQQTPSGEANGERRQRPEGTR